MKKAIKSINREIKIIALFLFILGLVSAEANTLSSNLIENDSTKFSQFKGKVSDSRTKNALSFATLSLIGENISTVTNSEGEFSIKIPNNKLEGRLLISFIGYKKKTINVKELKAEDNTILLEPFNIALGEVIVSTNNANQLIEQVLSKINQNYGSDQNLMTGFYRETIKKRKTYLSLTESVVEIEKQAYNSNVDDIIQLFKGRKYTDYNKLDTLSFKLQGGPYTCIYLDIMKNPEMIFTDDPLANYNFTLENNTQIGDNKVYVLSFKQKPQIVEPLYFGKLYIDMESLAVISATFNLNIENKKALSKLLIQKKPIGSEVYPILASYQINYRESDGKWLFAYSRGDINFKVNWAKKLFNSNYDSTIELAVTKVEKKSNEANKSTERLKQNVIMIDKVSNFADVEFWGEYNIIEPEKSIEAAIKKIQKQL
ncbi:carboxypeptidase-like regulatory domain-containing protein [Daejeonella sp.]|uniref:carboxypeptidase-like regulatory domain-containing protein n=1 Tax=Daejeonella sp. TaxID=2805397 RepID=UPI0025BE550C|nr:carboxypeptidase-like regulatory domain-containing protein [Daejeonella sp.]